MEKYGRDYVVVGCSESPKDDEYNDSRDGVVTLNKWLVNVQCEGCLGLYYRSSPGVIVPDADWPRNGDIVVGSEIPDIPGKLQRCSGIAYHIAIEGILKPRTIICYYKMFKTCNRLDQTTEWILSSHCK